MARTVVQAEISYLGDSPYGPIVQDGLSRDWRCSSAWAMAGMALVPELKAFAPWGRSYPGKMSLSEWDIGGNGKLRETEVSSAGDTRWLQFYDGAVYAAGSDANLWGASARSKASWQPNWVLQIAAEAPPAGQGVTPQVSVRMECEVYTGGMWRAGYATFVFPQHSDQYVSPFLHVIAPKPFGAYDMLTTGSIVSYCQDVSANKQGPQRVEWVCQYWPLPDRSLGGHIILHNESGARWAFRDRYLRLAPGRVMLSCGGCVQYLDLTPIQYPLTDTYLQWHSATPQAGLGLPTCEGAPYNPLASWGGLWTAVDGWETEVRQNPAGDYYRPEVRARRMDPNAWGDRPICWSAWEEHAPILGTIVGSTETTHGKKLLANVSLQAGQDGMHGTAELHPSATQALSNWKEGGQILLEAGAGTGALALATFGKAYIALGGLPRELNGKHPGRGKLTLEFGDFQNTFLNSGKGGKLVDVRQGGAQLAGAWFRACMLRCGIPAEQVSVAADVEALVIPWAELPSEPSYAPGDGTGWREHLQDVCDEIGCEWGTNKTTSYEAWIAKKTASNYVAGVTPIVLAITTTAIAEDLVTRLRHVRREEGRANALKAIAGNEDAPAVHYWIDSVATRAAEGGRIVWDVVRANSLSEIGAAVAKWARDNHAALDSMIEWDMTARAAVKVGGHVTWEGTAYRIVDVRPTFDAGANEAKQTCTAVKA